MKYILQEKLYQQIKRKGCDCTVKYNKNEIEYEDELHWIQRSKLHIL